METWLTNNVARRIFIDQSLHTTLKNAARARGHSEGRRRPASMSKRSRCRAITSR
jgi:hypothetical protein